MCGIVGFTGNNEAAPILLDGLSKLEYRGYDSAGIAVRNGDAEPEIVKAKGKLKVLKEMTNDVHNGIIENYQELREKLIKKGYTFKSETDTEVAVKLIDYYYKKYLGTPGKSCKRRLRYRSYPLGYPWRAVNCKRPPSLQRR